jgi:hypothetical protein
MFIRHQASTRRQTIVLAFALVSEPSAGTPRAGMVPQNPGQNTLVDVADFPAVDASVDTFNCGSLRRGATLQRLGQSTRWQILSSGRMTSA